MTTVLVTGGTGYIGSHTIIELLQAGCRVIAVDNFANSKPEVLNRIRQVASQPFQFYQINITDKFTLETVFANTRIDAVIHFAGYKAVGESVSSPLKYYRNNIMGTLCLCELMQKYDVRTLVFSSSATVYGLHNTSPLTEDMPLSTTNPYGATKLMIEQILQDWHVANPQTSISLLRYFNPVGAHESGLLGEDPHGIPNNLMPFITQVATGRRETLSVFGNDYETHDGTGVRDYVHVVDLAKGHISALSRAIQKKGVDIYNLGTGKGYSVLDMINTFEQVNNVKIPYQIVGRRQGDIGTCYANVEKAFQELGWKAEKDVIMMCRDAWSWQQKNPCGYDIST